MSNIVAIEKYLVTTGNHAVFASGQKVFDCPNGDCTKNGGIRFNGLHGQPVFYDPKTRLSVDPSAAPLTKSVVAGVFWDRNNDGIVDEIRKAAAEKIGCNLITGGGSQWPESGQEEVSKFMFTCTNLDTLYTLHAEIETDRTHKEFPAHRKAVITGQYKRTTGSCDDCDTTLLCREVACGIVDSLNGDRMVCDLWKGGWPQTLNNEPFPVKFFVYNENTYVFNLDAVEGACGGCADIEGITGIQIAGAVYPFWGTTSSADSTLTKRAQLQHFINQVNDSFEKHQGFAWYANSEFASDNACMPVKVKVNSCLVIDGLLDENGNLIAPDEVIATEYVVDDPKNCVSCGENNDGTLTYSCAIGAVGYMAEEECDCESGPENPARYWPTHVYLWGEGFVDDRFDVVQRAAQPINLGSQLWNAEYHVDTHSGYFPGQLGTGGKYGGNSPLSRIRAVMTDCQKAYCTLAMTYRGADFAESPNGFQRAVEVRTTWLVPQDDTVTKASLLADLNGIKDLANCAIDDFSCTDITPLTTPAPTPTVTRTPAVSTTVTKTPTNTPSVTKTPSTTITPTVTVSPSPA